MKKLVLALVLVLALCVPAFAWNDTTINGGIHDSYNTDNSTNNTAIGGAGGAGGSVTIGNIHPSATATGGSATANGGSVGNITVRPEINVKPTIDTTDVNVNVNRPVNIVAPDITNKVRVNTNIDNTDINVNKNVIERGAVKNDNTNIQGQLQGQGQEQSVNNGQTIAPSQNIVIETPRPLLPVPTLPANALPQLSFGEVKGIASIPVDARLRDWNGEIIIDVVSTTTTKAKKLFKKTVNAVRNASTKEDLTKCRIITLSHPSTKMWSTGGNLSMGGAGNVGTSGVSGGGGLLPSFGRMTADTIVDIIIVRVVN